MIRLARNLFVRGTSGSPMLSDTSASAAPLAVSPVGTTARSLASAGANTLSRSTVGSGSTGGFGSSSVSSPDAVPAHASLLHHLVQFQLQVRPAGLLQELNDKILGPVLIFFEDFTFDHVVRGVSWARPRHSRHEAKKKSCVHCTGREQSGLKLSCAAVCRAVPSRRGRR